MERLETGLEALLRGCAEGRHPGGQVYVSRWGRPVVEYCAGEAQGGISMELDSILPWFSAGKPLVAALVMLLVDRGELDLDVRIAEFRPTFLAGKAACTLRHVLTHQGGFAQALLPGHGLSHKEALAYICAYPAEYPPGEKAGYHPLAGWHVLAEVIRIRSGMPVEEALQKMILEPLGMDSSCLGIPLEKQRCWAQRIAHVQAGYTERTAWPGATPESLMRCNDAEGVRRGSPGGGMRGSARDLGRFYEWLLAKGRWEGKALVDPRSVELFTACHRWGLPDLTLGGAPLAWGLGFAKHGNADVHRGYSRRQYGHSGQVSCVALADPEHGLVFVALTTGLLDPLTNARRLRELSGSAVEARIASPGA